MTSLIDTLWVHLWESSLFALICGGLILSLDRLKCARTRHLLAWAGLVKFLIPFSYVASFINPAALPAFLNRDTPTVAAALQLENWAPLADSAEEAATISPAVWFFIALWLTGVAAFSALWLYRIKSTRLTINERTSPASQEWETDAKIWWDAHARSVPQLRFANDQDLPAGVFGWLRPVVIIPQFLQDTFDAAEREAFLRHEFQHLYKRDPFWLLVQIFLRNLLWMHPLIWWLEHRIRMERELVRDEEVIRKTRNPNSYLSCLMKASKIDLSPSRATSVCLNGSPFARRVKAIARAGRSSVASTLSAVASATILAVFSVFLLAAQPAAAFAESSEDESANKEGRFEDLSPDRQLELLNKKERLAGQALRKYRDYNRQLEQRLRFGKHIGEDQRELRNQLENNAARQLAQLRKLADRYHENRAKLGLPDLRSDRYRDDDRRERSTEDRPRIHESDDVNREERAKDERAEKERRLKRDGESREARTDYRKELRADEERATKAVRRDRESDED